MDVRAVSPVALLLAVGLNCAGCAAAGETTPVVLTTEYALRDDMRQLWAAQATWSRVVIVSTVAGLEDTPAATDRLLRNGSEIADAFRPFYGGPAAYRLHALLNDHVTGLREVIASTMAADNAGLEAARTLWYANADELARFLADLNPNWGYYELWRMFRTNLDATVSETMARVGGHWDVDVTAHDAVVSSTRPIADGLADGITMQFPELVTDRTFTSVRERDLHVSMRVLFEAQVSWTRFYLIDALAGLPSTPETTARLVRSGDDLADAIRQIYGATAADRLTTLLDREVEILGDFVSALAEGDRQAVAGAIGAWYRNATEIAAFLASLNPVWSFVALETQLHEQINLTSDEATARVRAEWESDVVAYDLAVVHILNLSDVIASGIAQDLPPPAPQQTF